MCSYNTLKSSADGYVVQCRRCNHIQVGFGTIVVSFTITQFQDFIMVVEEHFLHYRHTAAPDHKLITIPTTAKSVAMVFTLNELAKLRMLLADGQQQLAYNQLLQLCEN